MQVNDLQADYAAIMQHNKQLLMRDKAKKKHVSTPPTQTDGWLDDDALLNMPLP